MTDDSKQQRLVEALSPLLSEAAVSELSDLSETMEAMAYSRSDKLRANGLRLLLDNHAKRKAALREAKP